MLLRGIEQHVGYSTKERDFRGLLVSDDSKPRRRPGTVVCHEGRACRLHSASRSSVGGARLCGLGAQPLWQAFHTREDRHAVDQRGSQRTPTNCADGPGRRCTSLGRCRRYPGEWWFSKRIHKREVGFVQDARHRLPPFGGQALSAGHVRLAGGSLHVITPWLLGICAAR